MTQPVQLKKEFKELFIASGWTQAEAARKLHMTRGGVNGIVTGRTMPSPGTLDLFRRVLVSEKPEALSRASSQSKEPRSAAIEEIGFRISELAEPDRKAVVDVIKATLDLVEKKQPRKKVTTIESVTLSSSKGSSVGREDLRKISEAIRQVQESERGHKAASTIDKKRAPSSTTLGDSSSKPSPPRLAPDESDK